jgi:hypothetical protein
MYPKERKKKHPTNVECSKNYENKYKGKPNQ